jgi:hypothetical protein
METVSAKEYAILLKAFVRACNLLAQHTKLHKSRQKKVLTPEELMVDLITKAKEEYYQERAD